MNDLDLVDRHGPAPTGLDDSVLAAARARLDHAVRNAPTSTPRAAAAVLRPRRRVRVVLAAAAAAALAAGAVVLAPGTPVALADVDPLVFPVTPAPGTVDAGLGEPSFERFDGVAIVRYGEPRDGINVVTGVDEQSFWEVPPSATRTSVDGVPAVLWDRDVHGGARTPVPGVTVVWDDPRQGWTGVTGAGSHADTDEVLAVARGLRDVPQEVVLPVRVAPEGWTPYVYKLGAVSFHDGTDGGIDQDLVVGLGTSRSVGEPEAGLDEVRELRLNGADAWIGKRGETWLLAGLDPDGTSFTVQAPDRLSQAQVVAIARTVDG